LNHLKDVVRLGHDIRNSRVNTVKIFITVPYLFEQFIEVFDLAGQRRLQTPQLT